jgi:hypothetical protein
MFRWELLYAYKPSRFSVGETSTVCLVKNAFKSDGTSFDFDEFIKTLNKLEETLGEFVKQ